MRSTTEIIHRSEDSMTMLQTFPSSSKGETTTAFHNGWRGRFNAWFFTTFDRYIAYIGDPHKRQAFGDIQAGTIVEIGPGVGANFDFIPPGSRLVAIEPNLAMHDGLRERAAARDIDLELLAVDAERLPLESDSVDDVVCSLVLCTVDDPGAALTEIRRVLRPGGRFRFVEHVAAPRWSPRRWLQHLLRKPWRWIYEGCDICRNTGAAIKRAGFSRLQIREGRFRHSLFVPINTAIYGIAIEEEGADAALSCLSGLSPFASDERERRGLVDAADTAGGPTVA
jgi:SAM-dependent methyltransferase